MSVKSILVAFSILAVGASLLPTGAARAQTPTTGDNQTPPAPSSPVQKTPPVKTFKLLHESATAAKDLEVDDEAERWVPGIRPGSIELSMSLGFMNLSGTLLEHQQMIYKYTTDSTYWGDVKITGQTAFNPLVRIGYTLKPWLTLEGLAGLSISEYSATVENRWYRKNEQGAPPQENPELGKYDAEARSLITLQTGGDVLVYPLNISGDGLGRWHPYLTAQCGAIWYDMNSDFTATSARSTDLGFGGGLRLLAERNVSLRLEATYHLNSVEFTPTDYFLVTNEGTTLVPLLEYPQDAEGAFSERRITAFTQHDLNYLTWSIGFQGSF